MFIADIKRVVEQVSRDKGIDREVLIKAVEEATKEYIILLFNCIYLFSFRGLYYFW